MSTVTSITQASADRFVSTLFITTLVHGVVILGVSFDFTPLPSGSPNPTLEVVIVQGPAEETAPEDADYIAQQNQTGDGNTEENVRPNSQISNNLESTNQGEADGLDLESSETGQQNPLDQLVTRSSSLQLASNIQDSADMPELEQRKARLMLGNADPAAASDSDEQLLAHSDDPREKIIAVNTREANFAAYLDRWRQRIEELGTVNFPDDARRDGLAGNPVLEVAINQDGSIREIIVRRSSNHKVLDQSALRILRLAAPFEAFPKDIRENYDVLRFVYEWRFLGDGNLARGRLSK
ncbi:MAG: TonB family protein [Pseudomonadota bacterium]